jgi:hypothetical protein
MKRLLASALCIALAATLSPINLVAAARQGAQANVGVISGTAKSDKGDILRNHRARLLDNDRNDVLVSETRTNSQGEFSFTGLPVGNFIVEVIDDEGRIVARTVKISLAAGAMAATGLALSGSAAGVGAAAAGAAAASGAFITTTAGIITAVAVGAGVTAAVVAATNDASASGG